MTRSIPQISRYLVKHLRRHRLQVVLNTLLGTVLVGLDLAFVWATKQAIDIATGQSASAWIATLTEALWVIGLIMVGRIVLGIAMRWIRAILGVKAQNSMRASLFSHLLACRWQELRGYHTGNLTSRMEKDVTDVVNFVTEHIPTLVTTLVQFVGAFLFLFYLDSQLAVIVVCVLPFFVVSAKLYVKTMRRLSHEARESESRIQSIIQETLRHSLVVKTLRRMDRFLRSLTEEQAALHVLVLRRTRYSTISSGLLNLGFATGYFVTFAWGATSLAKGLISYGAMLAFIQLVGQIQGPVRTLSRFVPIFITAFTATERLIDLEELPEEVTNRFSPLPPDRPIGIEVSNLTFRYTPTSRKIFDGFSFSMSPGAITAIVGETGSGKTTFIRLLLALVSPEQGEILLKAEGEEKAYAVSPSFRRHFAYVPQGNTLFSGTIRSNLLLGNPEATDAQLQEALHTAAADFVGQLPQGLDAPCGESGDGLSEGQAQRIAIARTLLSNSPIFIFDEATSALDSATEATVIQRISVRYKGHTMLFITHRPEVLKVADCVMTMA